MKTGAIPRRYISGPHSGDYYLLHDERSDYIFAMRLIEHIGEASGSCGERANLATAVLLEMWIDDTEKLVWYVFEACGSDGDRSSRSRFRSASAQP